MNIKLNVTCSYCGFANRPTVEMSSFHREPRLVIDCDMEEGGYDQSFVVAVGLLVATQVYTMKAVAPAAAVSTAGDTTKETTGPTHTDAFRGKYELYNKDRWGCDGALVHLRSGYWDDLKWELYRCQECSDVIAVCNGKFDHHWNYTITDSEFLKEFD